jgi:Mn2+/Fe2+ NRAMP family transporter
MNKIKNFTKKLGPGFIIAATGIGAGDMIAATVAGAKFGTVILWATLLGAFFKYVLNEGIARWQLTTGKTVPEEWIHNFKAIVRYYFIGYLFLWSFMVAGALMAACGLAAHTIFPGLSVTTWGIIHSVVAFALVLLGRYGIIENIMKFFIVLMFLTVIGNLFFMDINWGEVLPGFIIPRVPEGSVGLILGVIGGVGGSVTILSYGYWLREKKWNKPGDLKKSRTDLFFAYLLTGLFGAAIVILAAGLTPESASGSKIVIGLADELGNTMGVFGKQVFLIGFWGAVFSSMLGVWDGIPYMFNEYIRTRKNEKPDENPKKALPYRIFLAYLAFPPAILLFLGKPVWVIIIYSISGAFFMPFIAGMLIYMNNRRKLLGDNKNKLATNIALSLILVLFVALLVIKIAGYF